MDKRMMLTWLQGQAQKQELTTTKMQQKRLGIDLDEGLIRTTVDPETGEVDTGLLRRIAHGVSRATGLNVVKPISGKNWNEVERIRGEIESHNAELEDATQRNLQAKQENGVAPHSAARAHSEALAKWEVDREKFGTVRELPNYHEHMKHRMSTWQHGKVGPDNRWWSEDDHKREAHDDYVDMKRRNLDAEQWIKNNPRPISPEVSAEPEAPTSSPRIFKGPNNYPTSTKDINRQQLDRKKTEQITETIRRIQESQSDTITPGTKLAIDSAKQGLAKHGASKAATDLIAGKMARLAAEKPGTVGKIVAMPRTEPSGQTPQMKAEMILPTPQIADYEEITPEARERLKRLGY